MEQAAQPAVMHQIGDIKPFPALCQVCQLRKGSCPIQSQSLINQDELVLSGKDQRFDLEIIRLLADTGRLVLVACGTCMVPAILPSDKLLVVARPIYQVHIGEIAVYHRHGVFFGHRVIAIGQDETGSYIVTRPDSGTSGDDGPTYAGQFVGIVSRIERNGKVVSESSPARPACSQAAGQLISTLQSFNIRSAFLVKRLQKTRFYPAFAQLIRPTNLKDYSIELQTPHRDCDLLRKISRASLNEFHLQDLVVKDFSLFLYTTKEWVTRLRFVQSPDGCLYSGWWLLETDTRVRYHSLGLEEKLFCFAEYLFLRSGIDHINLKEAPAWLLPRSVQEITGWTITLRGARA